MGEGLWLGAKGGGGAIGIFFPFLRGFYFFFWDQTPCVPGDA